MNHQIELQIIQPYDSIPSLKEFEQWVTLVLDQHFQTPVSLCIRIIDEQESAELNKQHRQKNKATNVLSFPNLVPIPDPKAIQSIGDLALCAPIIKQEAEEQNKMLIAHWAHLVIHGTLHLLGYDHLEDEEAEVMEGLEIQLMCELGYPNPYEEL